MGVSGCQLSIWCWSGRPLNPSLVVIQKCACPCWNKSSFLGLGDPRVGSHDEQIGDPLALEVVLQGLPRGQGFRCEEAPRAEGAVVAIDIDDEDLKQLKQTAHALEAEQDSEEVSAQDL